MKDHFWKLERLEYFAGVVIAVLLFIFVGHFAWWWLLVLFFAFDIGLVGYIFSPRLGAITYNAIHSLLWPAILLGLYVLMPTTWLLFVGLLWLFHVCVDRTIGFGLMYDDRFGHSNLGTIRLPKIK